MDTEALGGAAAALTRAFVAVDPPEGHRRRLAEYLERCAALAPAFRWAPAANLHLTLRFCGSLEAPVVAALTARLAQLKGEAFEIGLGSTGTFGGRRHARVVWIGVDRGADSLGVLAAGVEEACRATGLEPEDRPFRAHLTLARSLERQGAPAPDLPEPPDLQPWVVDRFALYQSRLGRGPAVYSALAEFPLSPAR